MRTMTLALILFLLQSPVPAQRPELSREIYTPRNVPGNVLVDVIVPLFREQGLSFYCDPRLGQVIVEGTPDRLPPALEMLNKMDRPRSQANWIVDIILARKGSLKPQVPRELSHLAEPLQSFGGFTTFEPVTQLRFQSLEGTSSKMQILPGLTLEMRVELIELETKAAVVSCDITEEYQGVLRSLFQSTVRVAANDPVVQGGTRLTGDLNDQFLLVGLTLDESEKEKGKGKK